jgi:hypothetical protein
MKSNSCDCLLSVVLYEVTGAQLEQLREKHYSDRHAYKYLPEFCLTKENKIAYTDVYLQFINSGEEKFFLFDVAYTEQPLAEEISAMGLEDILDMDMSFLKTLTINQYEDMHNRLPMASHIVIEAKYVESGSYEYPEVEAEFSIVGYLNSDKILIVYEDIKV